MIQLLRVRNLVAAGVILFAMGSAYHALHTSEGILGATHGEPGLASADYRAPIATIEAELFAPGPLSMEQRIQLASAFEELARSVGSRDSHMAHFSARELRTLAAITRGLGDLRGSDLERIRNNWMRIRSNTFDDASWFRFSETDPVAPAVEPRTALSVDDLARANAIAAVVDRIDAQAERGEREVGRLGEPRPEGSVDPNVRADWQAWAPRWQSGIADLRRSLGEAPDAQSSMRVRFAWDSATRALGELDAVASPVTSGDRPPYAFESTRHFQNARRDLASARDWIAKAKDGRAV